MSREKTINLREARKSGERIVFELVKRGFTKTSAAAALTAILSLHSLPEAHAQENKGALDISGAVVLESNKTNPQGFVLQEGPYANFSLTGQYTHGDNKFTVTGILGTPLDGENAWTANKLNLQVCGNTKIGNEVDAQFCTTHFFNPPGEPFNEIYAVLSNKTLGVRAGDFKIEDNKGPFAELFIKGQKEIGERYTLRGQATVGTTLDPDVPYGSVLIEFKRDDGTFGQLHLYQQEDDGSTATVRVGKRF